MNERVTWREVFDYKQAQEEAEALEATVAWLEQHPEVRPNLRQHQPEPKPGT